MGLVLTNGANGTGTVFLQGVQFLERYLSVRSAGRA